MVDVRVGGRVSKPIVLTLNSLRRVLDEAIVLLADRAVRMQAKDSRLWSVEWEAKKRASVVFKLRRFDLFEADRMLKVAELVRARRYDSALAAVQLTFQVRVEVYRAKGDAVTWRIVQHRLARVAVLVVEQVVAEENELLMRQVMEEAVLKITGLPVVEVGASDRFAVEAGPDAKVVDYDQLVEAGIQAVADAKRALIRMRRQRRDAAKRGVKKPRAPRRKADGGGIGDVVEAPAVLEAMTTGSDEG